MEITKLPLTPLISLFGRNMHKPYSILFFHFLHSNHFNLMPHTSISLIPNQFQHVIQNALSNPNHHVLYFSNPNLIHFFLNLYQNHHDSTLNTTNLTSIQENQGIMTDPPFLVTGICRQLHSNLPAKLARLTSYHEAKPLKLLKLPLKNVGYKKFFHLSIKITPLDLTKIRQHNDCTMVKPEIQNHL